MPFVGAVPGSLFTFRPVEVSINEQWRTLVTEFELGAEQRRSKWNAPRMTVQMRYERGVLTSDEVNDVWRFFRAMEGSHKAFDLPLFGRLTTIESVFTAGASRMGVADTQEFTTAVGSRYNKIYVQTANGDFTTFGIATVVDATTLEVQSASDAGLSFNRDDPVSGVIRARFNDSQLQLDYLPVFMSTIGIGFTEVRS